MRARTVNENYPLGAANDPNAPWNEPEDASSIELEFEGDDMYMVRRIPTGPDDYDEEKEQIHFDDFDEFAAGKLDLDLEQLYDTDGAIEVKDVIGDIAASLNFINNVFC